MSTEMTPNVPLLLKTLEHIENHPEEWNQAEWGCGTSGCFAFHAALIDGGKALVDHYFLADEDDAPNLLIPFKAADVISVRYRAKRILGITDGQAERLFSPANRTQNELSAHVYRLVGNWESLAEVTLTAATNGINDKQILPSAYVDPRIGPDEAHQLWDDLKDAISEWQRAEDGEVDLDTLEPQWRDAEVYTNHLRGLVDDAVHKLIGRLA